MKILHKNEAKKFENSKQCIAYEYPLEDKDINGAVIVLNGRYPDKGRAVNKKCKEVAYVVKGSGRVVIESMATEISEGDVILIEPGERFYWEGKLTMFMSCSPAWYPGQHKEVK